MNTLRVRQRGQAARRQAGKGAERRGRPKGSTTKNPLKWCFVCEQNKPREQFSNKFGHACSLECNRKAIRIQLLKRRGVAHIQQIIANHEQSIKDWQQILREQMAV